MFKNANSNFIWKIAHQKYRGSIKGILATEALFLEIQIQNLDNHYLFIHKQHSLYCSKIQVRNKQIWEWKRYEA